jgi:restriction system protein
MASQENQTWGIHSKDDNLFLENNVIAIGWSDLGDLSRFDKTREEFKKNYALVYPKSEKGSISSCAGQLYRFVCEMAVGDYVVFPSKIDRKINIGKIESDYYYDKNAKHYPNQRKVKWIKHLERTDFSKAALYEVGSALTLFTIKNYTDEFLAAIGIKPGIDPEKIESFVPPAADEIAEFTKDYILEKLSKNLKGYDLEDFIAELLQAMGYRTIVSPHGGDSGIDITAYKDELPPRILVQVKSQDSKVTEKDLQALKGAMREGDYGLFVALSDYAKNANKYLENTPIIRGINGSEIVDLILEYYEKLSDKYRKIIPLKMMYIPETNDDI